MVAAAPRKADPPSVVGFVSAALRGSGFPRSQWALLVVVIRFNEGKREVLTRDAFASWLRSNDLGPAAHECLARKIGPGEALAWCEVDTEGLSHAGFSKVKIA